MLFYASETVGHYTPPENRIQRLSKKKAKTDAVGPQLPVYCRSFVLPGCCHFVLGLAALVSYRIKR